MQWRYLLKKMRGREIEMSWSEIIKTFVTGGIICLIGQILIDFTKLTPARILVLFVSVGAVLTAVGIYEPLVQWGGSGATIPLPGFGYNLAKGAISAVNTDGLLGALTGGIKQSAAGIGAAIFFGYIIALIFNPKPKM